MGNNLYRPLGPTWYYFDAADIQASGQPPYIGQRMEEGYYYRNYRANIKGDIGDCLPTEGR